VTNPVLVEVVRGRKVESEHRASAAVVDADNKCVIALGDVVRPVFPRSAVKPIQALILVESGGADQFGYGEEELALACASHSGEPEHVAVAERMLACLGLDDSALACGVHWPLSQAAALSLARAGRGPSALHHNCSGKHAGFLCAATAMRAESVGYVNLAHPVQQAAKAALEDLSCVPISGDCMALDGCSVPTWALPLASMAYAFARFGTGRGLAAKRAEAALRLRRACANNPFHVAGSDRFCTKLMQHFGMRLLVKVGAEGMMCAALPEEGLGIAVKCDDGAARAAEVVMAALLDRLMPLTKADRAVLELHKCRRLQNWRGIDIGWLRPAAALRLGAPD
jgi:L-asparaginase II